MKPTRLIPVATALLLAVASAALADGMLLTSLPYVVREDAQRAVIRHDAGTGLETLDILPSFRGTADHLAWIVPLPAVPEVTAGDAGLFREMENVTAPLHRYRDGEWNGCDHYGAVYSPDGAGGNGVEIIDDRLVGYYRTMTLAADQAPALLDSLTGWGFLHEGNIDQATELINSYVDQGWFFVTVKVDSSAFAATYPYYQPGDNFYGQLEPLSFAFASDETIYPMRISALSAAEATAVTVWVVADHRMDFAGAVTRYANRFDQAEIRALQEARVKELLQPGDFLTCLHRSFSPRDMSADLVIVRAAADKEYRLVYYSGFPWMTVLLLGPAFLWLGYRKARRSGPLPDKD